MNESKIIFLDFDGVLNRFHCETIELYRLEKDIVQIFVDTVKEVGAKIVISSSWRRRGKEFIVNTLKKKNAFELLNYLHEDSICPEDNKGSFRGNEINLWLKNHQDENIKYLILDDESDFFEDQPRLQIIPDIGFSDIDALFVKAYFGIDIEKICYFYSINSTILKIVNNRSKLADKFIPSEKRNKKVKQMRFIVDKFRENHPETSEVPDEELYKFVTWIPGVTEALGELKLLPKELK